MSKRFLSGFAVLLASLACFGSGGSAEAAPAPAAWTKVADYGGGAMRGSVWFTGPGAAYVVSGMGRSFVPDNQCWKYDGVADTWTAMAAYPGTPVIDGAGFAIGTKGYVALGSDNVGWLSQVWEYDMVQDTWTRKRDFPGSPRSGVVATVIGQKAYVFGGGRWPASTGELWEYDPRADAWTQKTSCPGGGRFMGTAFTVGSKGYFGMGQPSGTASSRDMYEYDPAADTWTPVKDYPGSARAYAIGMSLGNKGYVGAGDVSGNGTVMTREVWEYDPATDAWTRKPDLGGEGRGMAVGFGLGGYLYLGLGNNAANRNLPDFWRWRP